MLYIVWDIAIQWLPMAPCGNCCLQVHIQREAVLIRGLHDSIRTTTRVDFGSVPQNIEVTRTFSAFNQSGFEVDIDFTVHVWEKRPGTRWVDVDLLMQVDGHVKVAARCGGAMGAQVVACLRLEHALGHCPVCAHGPRGDVSVCRATHTTAEECASFDIHPKRLHLGVGGSGKVTVRFWSPAALHHEAIIVGKQRLRHRAESVAANIMSHPDSTPAQLVLRGSFHPYAGPPPAPLSQLEVHLSSFCIQPRLQCVQTLPLQWAIHSMHGPTAGSRQQTVTLCNRTGSPLSFHMTTTGPFEVSHVVTSVPQEAHRFFGLTCFNQQAREGIGSGAYFLPPQESVDVAMQCVLGAPKHGSEDCRATGVLYVRFSNGHVQEEAMEARVLHPRLQCKGRSGDLLRHVDFGRVAVGATRVVQVVLENPSEVDAVWAATVCGLDAGASPGPGEDARSAAQRRRPDAGVRAHGSELGCEFSARPVKGVLHGSTPERLCAHAVLTVSFSPKNKGEVVAELCFTTCGGASQHVTLRGTASVDECDEPNWRLADLCQ